MTEDVMYPDFVGRNGRAIFGTKDANITRWGEVTSFSTGSSRFSALMLTQAIIGLWFLGFAIAYLVEAVGPTYVNNWIAFLFWSIGGGVFIIILQSVFFFLYFAYNGTDVTPNDVRAGPNINPNAPRAYLSAAYTKEVFLGYIGTLFIFIFVFWIWLGWLLRQNGAGCCSGPDIDALFADPVGMDYNNYRFAILLIISFSIIGVIEMVRVFYVHMNPLATVRDLRQSVGEGLYTSVNAPTLPRRD